MRTIYIDTDFKCHPADNGGMYAVETDFFDSKCDAFVEGFRFVPAGQEWTNEKGVVFQGEMIAAWKPYSELDAAQREYDRALIADMRNALNKLGVTLDE